METLKNENSDKSFDAMPKSFRQEVFFSYVLPQTESSNDSPENLITPRRLVTLKSNESGTKKMRRKNDES